MEKPLWTVTDRLKLAPGRFAFHSCPACKSASLSPVPSAQSLQGFYPDRYLFRPGPGQPGPGSSAGDILRRFEINLFYRRMIEMEAGILTELGLPKKAKFLDVGSGEGQWAEFLRELGFGVEGLEISQSAARSTRERLNITVHTESLEDLARRHEGQYNAVMMYNVLEHFSDAESALLAARKLLGKEGWLVLKVPLRDGLSIGMLGGRHICVREAPRHVTLPSYPGLIALLSRTGFEIKRVRASSLISRAGLVGLSLVPAGFYASAADRSPAGYFGVRFLALAAAAVFGIPVALLESLFRRPVSMIVAAQVRP